MHSIGKDRQLLGILGGLGPLSSAYFYELITYHTKAARDQDHIDIILSSRATTPDRTDFILGKSDESPVPFMVEDARLLEQYGADAIVIPCNTAHYFIEEVRNSVNVPVPSILEETAKHIQTAGFINPLILATEGTVKSDSYQRALADVGVKWEVPNANDQKIVTKTIYEGVKAGQANDARELLSVATSYFEKGCDCAILGCTELSVLKPRIETQLHDSSSSISSVSFVDSLECLANVVIKMFGHETVGFDETF